MRYDALDSGRRMHLLGVTAGQVPKRSNGWKETTAEKLFVVSALPLAAPDTVRALREKRR